MPKTFVYPFIKSGDIFRPLVPIIIINPIDKEEIGMMALLDTGADACVFTKFVAENTKHNLKADGVISHITQGVGENTITTWKHTFKISLLSPDRKSKIWSGKQGLVSCLDHDNAPPLLGCLGFLEFFNIRFNYLTKKIIIELP